MTDPIVDAVCAKLQSRSAVGIKKYGTTLAGNYATAKERLIHIQEELMDGANYVEWLLQEKEMPTPMTIEMKEKYGVMDATYLDQVKQENSRKLEELTKMDKIVTPPQLSNADERKAALDALKTLQRTLIAFIRENERQDILPFVKKDLKTILSVLQSPRVPAIDYLDKEIALTEHSYKNGYAAFLAIHKAARAYAELQKGV